MRAALQTAAATIWRRLLPPPYDRARPDGVGNRSARDMNDTSGHPFAGHAIALSGTPLDPVGYAPELGRNTEEELLEAGYPWEEIETLRRDEII